MCVRWRWRSNFKRGRGRVQRAVAGPVFRAVANSDVWLARRIGNVERVLELSVGANKRRRRVVELATVEREIVAASLIDKQETREPFVISVILSHIKRHVREAVPRPSRHARLDPRLRVGRG
jgi:hypothetical protein